VTQGVCVLLKHCELLKRPTEGHVVFHLHAAKRYRTGIAPPAGNGDSCSAHPVRTFLKSCGRDDEGSGSLTSKSVPGCLPAYSARLGDSFPETAALGLEQNHEWKARRRKCDTPLAAMAGSWAKA